MKGAKQAIYMDIMLSLKEKISNSEYQVGQKLTELALANDFNCSRITAKKALDELEHEGLIIRKKGSGSYVADASARPESVESKNISMILPPGFLASNLMEYFYGASTVLSARGYILGTASVDPSDSLTDGDLILRMIQNNCAGIIYYPAHDNMNTELLTMLSMNDFPLVTIDKQFSGVPTSSVISDNYNGTHELTKLLLNKGHKNIAFVSNENINATSTIKNRFLGYATALKEHGFGLNLDNIVSEYNQELKINHPDIYNQVINLLPLKEEQFDFFTAIINRLRANGVTAIVGATDIVAMYMIKTCEHLGLSIPGDMALVGFDDHILLQHMGISVTTVRQDFYAMGYRAAELLMKKIDNRTAPCENLVFPVEIVERTSSGAIE